MQTEKIDSGKAIATALVGFGKIAQGYGRDKVMAKAMEYASHAQVLSAHPRLNWCTVIDPDREARQLAADFGIEDRAASIKEAKHLEAIELAVLATPPGGRLAEIQSFPNLKAVLLEKPLAKNLEASSQLIDYCREKSILVQVNLLRRADQFSRSLMNGATRRLIGELETATCLYGNGLRNNGLHMIDLVRMVFGEVHAVQALSQIKLEESPIEGDFSFPFSLTLANKHKTTIVFTPVSFKQWRENGFLFFGSNGRLDYLHGGLTLMHYKRKESRMGGGEMEIEHDCPEHLEATIGRALYAMYDNLLTALDGTELFSTGASALATTAVVEELFTSFSEGGALKLVQ